MSNIVNIGVLGDMPDTRSARDRQMQRTFCGCQNIEPYISSGIGITVTPQDLYPRSQMDIMMQKEFNPYYKQSLAQNCQAEGYCGPNGAPTLNRSGLPSWYTANPYIQSNRQSGTIKYAPLQ
jgi:hypothetical protein